MIKLRSVWINRYNENFLYLFGFILLSGSIDSDKHNWASEIFESVQITSYKENVLDLYGSILFSGSIESDNYIGDIEKLELSINVTTKCFARVWLHALKWLYRA